jgi:hypothetical protein
VDASGIAAWQHQKRHARRPGACWASAPRKAVIHNQGASNMTQRRRRRPEPVSVPQPISVAHAGNNARKGRRSKSPHRGHGAQKFKQKRR